MAPRKTTATPATDIHREPEWLSHIELKLTPTECEMIIALISDSNMYKYMLPIANKIQRQVVAQF